MGTGDGMTHHADFISIERWGSEQPLFAVSFIISLCVWLVVAAGLIGAAVAPGGPIVLVYVAMFVAFFTIGHIIMVSHIRGSAVRLGPEQFPELWNDVERLSRRMGMSRVPETYVMQMGGALNAFATRFFGRSMVVLFSDLLEACGPNTAARNMIITHELGHIHAGHLRWHWFLLPSAIVPFLGSALSRAREYTCDRYGRAGAGETDGALLGLTILAAGGVHGPKVNRQAMMQQRAAIGSSLMTLGEWFSSHPPLVKRMAALEPRLAVNTQPSGFGAIGAAAIVIVGFGLLISLFISVTKDIAAQAKADAEAAAAAAPPAATPTWLEPNVGEITQQNATALMEMIQADLAAGRPLPDSTGGLYSRWAEVHPDLDAPMDPYDGTQFSYARIPKGYGLSSSGPDRVRNTRDDVLFMVNVPPGD